MKKETFALALALVIGIMQPATAAGLQAGSPATTVELVEFHHAQLDHYFMTAHPAEIGALDSGTKSGWKRTGHQWTVYAPSSPQPGTTNVCRFYGLPSAGLDSHFYSGSPAECAAVAARFSTQWMLESSNVFHVKMPDASTGACPLSDDVPVYRLFNNRADANHRYTSDESVRDSMLARGYSAEGYGPKGVAFCALKPAPATASSAPATQPSVSILTTQQGVDTFDFSSAAVPSTGASIVSYAWDFGDGASSTQASTTHRYSVDGVFPVVLTVKDSKQKSASAKKDVTVSRQPGTSAPPGTANPPGTTNPPGTANPPGGSVGVSGAGERVRVSVANTSFKFASKALHAEWVQGGGDWLDRNGVVNGPAPTISAKISGTLVSVDISGIRGDIIIQGIPGYWGDTTLAIDGQPATGFSTHESSSNSLSPPFKWDAKAFILNPTQGKTLTFNVSTAAIGATFRVDGVGGPLLSADPPMSGPSNRPDLADLEMTGAAAIQALGSSNVSLPYAFSPEFATDATGMKYLRFASDDAPRLISWWLPFAPRDEAWLRYALYIENDVADGMTELGVKLPGLVSANTGSEVSWRMEHGQNDPANRHAYAFLDYMYSAEVTSGGFPPVRSMGGATLRAGRWYVIEQHVRLNTPGQANGIAEVFLNGKLVWSRSDVKFRNQAATLLRSVHVNVYHGGIKSPSQPIHYRIAKIGVGSSRVGIPAELLSGSAPPTTGQPPATSNPPTTPPPTTTQPPLAGPAAPPPTAVSPLWRKPLVKGTFVPIAGTSQKALNDAQAINSRGGSGALPSCAVDCWIGFGTGRTAWVSAAASGHDQGRGDGWQNGVYKLDLAADSPKWVTLDPGSTRSAAFAFLDKPYYSDGRPTARHTYYSTQVIESTNRVMLFGAFAPAFVGYASPAYQGGPEVRGFDLGSGRWDPISAYPEQPFQKSSIHSVVKHPVTEDVYIAALGEFAKWTMATNRWNTFTISGLGSFRDWQYAPTLIDVTRNRLVFIHQRGKLLQLVDLSTYAGTTVPLSGAMIAADDFSAYSALVHDLDNDRYITTGIYDGQTMAIYAINPTTGESTRIASVPGATNGVYSRLAYFHDLGGVAYLPNFASEILFMPTR